jgi:hypothetical protein
MFTVIEDKGITQEQARVLISDPNLALVGGVNNDAAAEVLAGLYYINARRVWAEVVTICVRAPAEPSNDEVIKLLRECRTKLGL